MLTNQEIARVDQSIEEVLPKKRTSEDLEKRITLLVDLLVHIHTECKPVEDDPDQWHFHKCSSVALMHIFMEKHGIDPLMIVWERARQILGETLMLDPTILNALIFRTSHEQISQIHHLDRYSPNEMAIHILW